MKAYVVVHEKIHDDKTFDAYRKEVPATIARYGGRFIVRGGAMSVVEGEAPYPRVVIVEFPSRAAAESWYASAEYQKLLPLRLSSSAGNLIIVDGIDEAR